MSVKERVKDVVRTETVPYSVLKITPHVSNLNSTSRKLQASLYELFTHRYPKYPWHRTNGFKAFNKENLYLTVKDAPRFWWIIKMYGEAAKTANGEDFCQQRIEFYVSIPNDFLQAFKTKFHNHEQWKRATLEEEVVEFEFPQEHQTDMYSLKYSRNDMFSLEFDYTQQNSPIRDMLTIAKDLDVGESMYLFIQCETMSRRKWKSVVDYAWEQWEKGNVPSRPGFNPRMLGRDLANLGVRTAYEAKGLVDEVLAGVRMSFFNDKDKPEKYKPEFINSERAELLVNGDLSKRTKNKRNTPVFKTNIVFTVKSHDDVRRDMLARSVATAFTDLNGDNSLKPSKVTMMVRKEFAALEQWRTNSVHPNLMSIEEIGKIMQLPTADLQREFQDCLESNQRVENEVSDELMDATGILAGSVTDRGNTHDIHIQTKRRDLMSTARAFIGSPRMGKDQAGINLVVEAKLKHNMGAIVLDVVNEQNGHRGMADAIRDHLPPDQVIDLNIMDVDNPIYLGLEPIVKLIQNPRIAADRVAEELCNFLLTDGDEDKLQTSEHLREASKLTNADILSIKHLFTSEGFRNKLVEEKRNLFDVDIWEQYDTLSEGKQQAIYTPVMRRINQIMTSEYLKPIFCQRPNPALDLYKLIDDGKVVIFRMKSGLMPTRVIEILCYWIVLVSFLIKLAQEGRSNGTILVLNEPHQYLTDSLAHFIERIFSEGPKYRIIPLLIFHNFKQFKKFPGFVDIMKSSSLNWHIFKNTNEDVYKELFGYLGRTFENPAQAFEATKMYQYIGVWLDSEGSYYDPFVADALPLVNKRYKTYDNAYLTLEHSKIYGRPIESVLDEIRQRNKAASAANEEKLKKSGK